MQITSSTQTGLGTSASTSASTSNTPATPSTPASASRTAADSAKPKDASPAPPASSAKVTLSDEAKKKHYETKDAASDAADTASDKPQLTRNKSAIPSAETEKSPSMVKSLVYGALNLPSPAEADKNPDKAYSAGKWVGAVGTIIGVATLLLRFI